MRFRSKPRRPPTHNQGVLGSSPSGTTHSESKMKKSSENQRFSELFFFAHHGKIRQNNIGHISSYLCPHFTYLMLFQCLKIFVGKIEYSCLIPQFITVPVVFTKNLDCFTVFQSEYLIII